MKLQERKSDEYYDGMFQGKMFRFHRIFRGHRFSDEECRALFAGNRVEVHNIHGKKGVYAVQGCLKVEHLELISGTYDNAYFSVIDSVPNKPHFSFGMSLYDLDAKKDSVVLDDADLAGISFDDMPDLPEIKKEKDEIPLPSFRKNLFSCFISPVLRAQMEAAEQPVTSVDKTQEKDGTGIVDSVSVVEGEVAGQEDGLDMYEELDPNLPDEEMPVTQEDPFLGEDETSDW